MGPRIGDRVRAVTDDRDARVVEGLLVLNYVDAPHVHVRYVQVRVNGYTVVPASVEVLEPSHLTLDELAVRSKVFDLDDARSQGLLTPTRLRQGGSWADMFAELDKLVAPLLAAGWQRTGTSNEDSWEYGDSVTYCLKHADRGLEIELYESGAVSLWIEPVAEGREEPVEPDYNVGSEELTDLFEELGWIQRP